MSDKLKKIAQRLHERGDIEAAWDHMAALEINTARDYIDALEQALRQLVMARHGGIVVRADGTGRLKDGTPFEWCLCADHESARALFPVLNDTPDAQSAQAKDGER